MAQAPILRPDGTIATSTGYDPTSGYYLDIRDDFPVIPAKPTKLQAEAAYQELAEVFADFSYSSSLQSSVAIAAILTVFARPFIHGSVPGFLFDSPVGGIGKTLQTDCISTITTGRAAIRKAFPPHDEEAEKVFASYALLGCPLISIDDVKRPLGGESLDMLLTCVDEAQFRRLGKTEMLTLAWRAVLLFTGINVSFTGQTARRVLGNRLETTVERPQDRTGFVHHPLLHWVRENRPRLVVAALTVLRAFTAAGCPDMSQGTWGSFAEWAAVVPGAILYAGGPNVLAFRPPDNDDDTSPDVVSLRAIVCGLQALSIAQAPNLGRHVDGREGLTSGEILFAAFDAKSSSFEDHGGLRDTLRALTHTRGQETPSAGAIGSNLAKYRGRVVGVDKSLLRLVKVKDTHRAGADRWAVETIRDGATP